MILLMVILDIGAFIDFGMAWPERIGKWLHCPVTKTKINSYEQDKTPCIEGVYFDLLICFLYIT